MFDKQGHIREEFLDFIHCDEGTTGRALSGKIISSLQDNGLDMNYLRGQGYDGVGNMASIREGAAAHITAIYPKALYCHCAAHVLNLCVVAACKIQAVNKTMTTTKEINLFFSHSPKRQQELECHIAKMEGTGSNRRKLVDLCRTRWVARIEAFETFDWLFPAVVNTLEEVSQGTRNG